MTELKKFALRSGMVLSLAVFACTSVYAQGRSRADSGDEEESAGPDQNIDAQTGKILSEAIELLNMEMYAEARARLADLKLERLSPFERSRYEQLMFNLDMVNEDYPSARGHLQAAIESGGLNPQELSQMRYQMAQLFIQEEKYAEGAAALEAWIASEAMPNSGAYYLLAAAYYYQELFDKALPNAQKAVDLAGDAPQEGWLSMLASLLLQKEDYDGALPVVKRMVNLYSDKKTYWEQLAGIYLQKEDYTNALVVTQFANYAGHVTEERQITQLADLYSLQEMPYRAATLLEASMEAGTVEKDQGSYEKLGNAWTAAREFDKAVPVLTSAAELSENGELYLRVGQVQQQLEDWEASVESFENAIDKGGLRDDAYVEYLWGYSLYELDRLQEAKTHLQRAAREAEHRNSSESLIKAIDYELQNQ
jgi:tetratricopeptide (TPR) repeat protein